MAQNIWGILAESLLSNKTIREAIADMIADHEADPTAHLSETGSLQSHKASEIIDHEALSIVSDKIANKQITPAQLNTQQLFITPSFESVDGYSKTIIGVNSSIDGAGGGQLDLTIGETAGNRVVLTCVCGQIQSGFSKNPVLDCIVSSDAYDADHWVGIGNGDLDNASFGGVFFRYDHTANHVFASVKYKKISSPYTVTLVEVDLGVQSIESPHRFRIEVDNPNLQIRYFIDSVLKTTITIDTTKQLQIMQYFQFLGKMAVTSEISTFEINDLQYFQDI